MPARFGSMAASRRPAAARAAGSWRARGRIVERRRSSSARIASTTWSRKRPEVAAALLELVEERARRRRASPRTRASTNAVDDLGVGQAEQVADVGLVDPLGRRRQELVEHRLGVAHAAGGEPGDQVDRARRRPRRPSAARIRRELALDLGDGQAPDVEALEARQDRRREARRLGRGEHEDDERRAAPRAT